MHTPTGAPAASSSAVAACASPDGDHDWRFDRSICACGSMHYYCGNDECPVGGPLDDCPLDDERAS